MNLNIIIALVLIIIFVIILAYTNNNEKFAAPVQQSQQLLQGNNNPLQGYNQVAQGVGQPIQGGGVQVQQLQQQIQQQQQMQQRLDDRRKQLDAQEQKIDEKIGEQEGRIRQSNIDTQNCVKSLSTIGRMVGSDIVHDEDKIKEAINDNNKIINKNLKTIYETILYLKKSLSVDNIKTDKYLNNVGNEIHKTSQRNQQYLLNYISNISHYVDKLQNEATSAMEQTIIDKIREISLDLMQDNSEIKNICMHTPRHICDSKEECSLYSHGYNIETCDINTKYI
jgi:hypothetical protein